MISFSKENRNLLFTILIIILLISIFSFNFYNSTFRLSDNQVLNSFSEIKECNLKPGDIMIRRCITDRTWIFDKLLNPYFTHSAVYLNNNLIIQATGKQDNTEDEIQTKKYQKEEWYENNTETFFVIRPKYKFTNEMNNYYINIADDPEYKFGVKGKENKETTCTELILEQLIYFKILKKESENIPTPDYLFYIASNTLKQFEIIRCK